VALDFTTKERVANRLKPGESGTRNSTGASEDALIAQMITATSAAAEAFLDRAALAAAQTEYLDVEAGQTTWSLRAFPVTTFTSANYDPDQSWSAATALASTDYYDPTKGRTDALRLRVPLLSGTPDVVEYASLKIVYTGGMAATTAAFVSAYPDLALAVELQVVHDYQRKLDIGTVTDITPRASQVADFWIDEAKALLLPHRRLAGNAA
jgi:hypothetical protein